MKGCESQEKCAFYQKNKDVPGFRAREEVLRYCLSPGVDLCRRKVHQKRFGRSPSDELSPLGWSLPPTH